MKINRNNYEEFFLLCIDNELSVQDKKMLDEFLIQNPDLLEEFTMLQQSVLKPDEIIFDNKNTLIKELSLTNEAQENLLLLLDDELNTKEKKAAEKLVAGNPAIKEEWNILLKTKLDAGEKIIFEDKHLLYKEEKDDRVIPFGWWRVAVAAIFIGFGIWGGVSLLNNKQPNAASINVAENKPSINSKKEEKRTTKEESNAAIQPLINESTASADEQQSNPSPGKKIKQPTDAADKQVTKEKPANENNSLVKEQKSTGKPSNNLPKPYFENLNKNESNNTNTATVQQQEKEQNIIAAKSPKEKNSFNNLPEDKTAKENKYVTTAVFTENNEDNNPTSFDEDDDKARKTKLGGFLKKAKRMLERKTKIKTGDDNLKVANLSFAIQ